MLSRRFSPSISNVPSIRTVPSIGARFMSTVPKIDAIDQFPIRERQEAVLIERLPKKFDTPEQIAQLAGIDSKRVLLMKSTIGEFTGKAILLAGPTDPVSTSAFPSETIFKSLDKADTELFVEQCKRYYEFSTDLARLARMADQDGFNRIVTLTGVPKGYTRKDVIGLIADATTKTVSIESLQNIVFRFKQNGNQSDTCFVLFKSEADAFAVIKSVQEFAVPVRRVYGTSFGCSFVYADRSFLFLTDESLEPVLDGKCWIMTMGWNPELEEEQMASVLHKMAIYPNRVVKVQKGMGGEFLLRFDRMKNTKLVFSRLNRLKRRWRIPANTAFFAYPRMADIHYQGDEKHADEDSDCDSDLDEPVMY